MMTMPAWMMNKVMGAEALYFVGLAPSRIPAWPLTLGVVAFEEEFNDVAATAPMTVLRTASVMVEAILSTVGGVKPSERLDGSRPNPKEC